ncbi:hypothetical protein OMAG_000355 [Candidatus Omnitrophus magneticus]|uniref:Uncharacterized protein n=1 Tax=Candidatus Omnitrophus magneticus TaxID=1609969 RepID=A0A0F0CWH1_9BACT|nr:hypothetical protein OMAG_000355 [Candidatus Omnitrophus magneticus]
MFWKKEKIQKELKVLAVKEKNQKSIWNKIIWNVFLFFSYPRHILKNIIFRQRSVEPNSISMPLQGKRLKPFLKMVSLLVSFTFFIQEMSFPQGNETRSMNQMNVPQPDGRVGTGMNFSIKQFSIPRDVAITRDLNSTDSENLIINIKDVHDNYGAQKSIAEVLDNLLVNYDVRFIGIEGSEGYIDTTLLSSFPDEKVKKLTADYLMREGRISAGEFFTAVSKVPVTLYGIDDSELYLENYSAFLNLMEFKKENLKHVEVLRKALYGLRDAVFSDDLKSLIENSVLNSSGEEKSFTKKWDRVKEIGIKYAVTLEGFSNIKALERSVEVEKTINYEKVNSERDELLNILTKKVKREILEELVLRSLSFKLGRISKSQFYTYLLLLAKAENINKDKYIEMEKFCEYVTIYEGIDIAFLMDEMETYEEKIKDKLLKDDDAKVLNKLLKDIEILHNLYSVRLTRGQLKYLMDNMEKFKATVFLDFIKEEYTRRGMVLPKELSLVTNIFERLSKAVIFYSSATARNRAMVNNTIERMRKEGVTTAAIITGGFHTRGVTDILKAENISYLILLPKFNSETGKRPYVTILTNKHNEYKQYTENGSYLAVTSLFALSRSILEKSGMKENAERAGFETVLIQLGLSYLLKMNKGVVNESALNMLGSSELAAYLKNIQSAYSDILKQGKITREEYQSLMSFTESLKDQMKVNVNVASNTVSLGISRGKNENYIFNVRLQTNTGETAQVEAETVQVEKFEKVSNKNFNDIFKSVTKSAEKIQGKPESVDSAIIAQIESALSAESDGKGAEELLGRIEKIAARKGLTLSKEQSAAIAERVSARSAAATREAVIKKEAEAKKELEKKEELVSMFSLPMVGKDRVV